MAGLGDIAFWRQLRGAGPLTDPPDPVVPAGDGPLVLFCGAASDVPGLAQAMRRARPGLRLGALGPVAVERGDAPVPTVLAEPPTDPVLARWMLARLAPAALVLTDGVLPGALIAACDEADIPVTMIASRLPTQAAAAGATWRGGRLRNLMTRLSRVLVPDQATRDEALRLGLAPPRIEITGVLTPMLTPLPCNAREAAALRPLMRARPVWLAAALPLSETPAVLDAHVALLTARHRALLIVAPAHPAEAEPIAAAAEAVGLAVARRERDEDPEADIQVLVAEDSAELGLWYRFASFTFMGGTLDPAGADVARHPFEPAALGSAVIHGPAVQRHADDWRRLAAAGGARRVVNPVALRLAVEDLTAPDQAARLAHGAWVVATGGAAVVRRMADAVLSDLPEGAA